MFGFIYTVILGCDESGDFPRGGWLCWPDL